MPREEESTNHVSSLKGDAKPGEECQNGMGRRVIRGRRLEKKWHEGYAVKEQNAGVPGANMKCRRIERNVRGAFTARHAPASVSVPVRPQETSVGRNDRRHGISNG